MIPQFSLKPCGMIILGLNLFAHFKSMLYTHKPWKVGQNYCSLIRRHFVFLCSKLL